MSAVTNEQLLTHMQICDALLVKQAQELQAQTKTIEASKAAAAAAADTVLARLIDRGLVRADQAPSVKQAMLNPIGSIELLDHFVQSHASQPANQPPTPVGKGTKVASTKTSTFAEARASADRSFFQG